MKDPKGPVKSYKSPKELAKKHKVSLSKIINQVKVGTKIEGEHTTSKSGARITALQHVDELPDYYDRLKKVEKSKPMKESTVEQQYKEDTKYCLLCKKNETRGQCSYGPQMWDRYTIARIHPTNESRIHEDHKEVASGKKKDEEGYMARVEFDQIERSVNILRKLVKKGDQQLPAWVQSKITRAADFIDTAAEYLSSDEDVSEGMTLADFMNARKKRERSEKRKELSPTRRAGIHDPEKKPERDAARDAAHGETGHGGPLRPKKVRKARAVGELTKEEIVLEKRGLWDNIHARRKAGKPPKKPGEKGYPKTLDIEEGIKQARKNVGASKCWTNKKVDPNKPTKMKGGKEVPNCVPEQKTFEEFIIEVAAWQRKEGKNKEGGLNEKGRKSYERENPGSDLKPPQPEGGPRKRSFCARMGGMKGPMKDENGRPTRKALALRKWKC
jgi:hypothetical protein